MIPNTLSIATTTIIITTIMIITHLPCTPGFATGNTSSENAIFGHNVHFQGRFPSAVKDLTGLLY